MRTLISTVIVVCELSVAAADDQGTASPSAHPEFHQSILSEYRFVPKPVAPPPPTPAWSTHAFPADPPAAASAPPAVDGDVVRLPAVVVRGDRTSRAVDAALQSQAAQARIQRQYSRFGIGEHELRLGGMKVYVLTEFCIPVRIRIPF